MPDDPMLLYCGPREDKPPLGELGPAVSPLYHVGTEETEETDWLRIVALSGDSLNEYRRVVICRQSAVVAVQAARYHSDRCLLTIAHVGDFVVEASVEEVGWVLGFPLPTEPYGASSPGGPLGWTTSGPG